MCVQKLLCVFTSVLDTDLSFIFKSKTIQNCAHKNSNRDVIICHRYFIFFTATDNGFNPWSTNSCKFLTILEIHKINSWKASLLSGKAHKKGEIVRHTSDYKPVSICDVAETTTSPFFFFFGIERTKNWGIFCLCLIAIKPHITDCCFFPLGVISNLFIARLSTFICKCHIWATNFI